MPRKTGTVSTRNLARDSRTRIVLKKVEETLGGDIRASFASALKPHKLSELAMDNIYPLRWSDLDSKQDKELSRLLPFRRQDIVEYGDAIVVVAPRAVWDARFARKRELTEQLYTQKSRAVSAEALSRDIGARIDDTYEDLPSDAEIR